MLVITSLAVLALAQAAGEPGQTSRPAPPAPPPPLMAPDYPPTRETGPNLPPVPKFPDFSWVSGYDYPKQAREEGRQGSTTVRLTITQWGRVADCRIIKSSGHADLDSQTCASIARDKQFEPATDADAKPTSGTIEHTVNWQLDEEGRPISRDLAPPAPPLTPRNTISRYPQAPRISGIWYRPTTRDAIEAGLQEGQRFEVPISFTVEADGSLTNCTVLEPVENDKVNAASCGLLNRVDRTVPALGIDGKPTSGRIEQTIIWYAPQSQTTVVPRESFPPARAPQPISLPDLGTGLTSFTLEHDAQGKLLSCTSTFEGNLPDRMNYSDRICENAKTRGVETATDENGENVARKVTVEMRIKTEKTGKSLPEN